MIRRSAAPGAQPLQRSDSPPPYRSCPEQRNLQVTDTAFKLPCLNESWFEDVQLLSFRLSYLDHHGLSFAIVCNDLKLRPVSHGKDRVFRWVDLFPLNGEQDGARRCPDQCALARHPSYAVPLDLGEQCQLPRGRQEAGLDRVGGELAHVIEGELEVPVDELVLVK